jgi:REP element-mobilizing transposase RayT
MAAITANLKTKDLAANQPFVALHFFHEVSRAGGPKRTDMEKRYWNHVLWSPSYFAASCGGAPLSIIKQYIEQQKTPL